MDNSIVEQPINTPFTAAKQASISAIRHARTLVSNSDNQEDQEAIEKFEGFAGDTATDTVDTALSTKDSIKRRIRKKTPDIKNKKTIKAENRTIRIADNSVRTAQKSTTEATKAAHRSATQAAKQTAIATQKIVSARKTERLAKKSAEWVKKIVKGIINSIRKLMAALGISSVPILIILIIATMIAAIAASAFGIFFSGDTSGENTKTIQDVILEINSEYLETIDNIEKTVAHDEVTKEGYGPSWPDVLSVYAVYVTTKTDGATDVVHLTDDHIKILKDIFWQMTTVAYTTEVVTETKQVPDLDKDGNQKKDKDGNLLYKEEKASKTILHISISHLSAGEEAAKLSFNSYQMAQLNELLDTKYASFWADILKGIGLGSSELVNLALSQLGNEGGEKFWRWAGLDTRCEWCALFVSWCGDQTGLRAAGQIPYFSFVSDGVSFYKNKNKWIDGSEVNSSNCDKLIQPGMIIFFDWEPDGKPNHVGIVTKVANGYIYTVEGNSNDAVREKQYSANSNHIFGFGIVG